MAYPIRIWLRTPGRMHILPLSGLHKTDMLHVGVAERAEAAGTPVARHIVAVLGNPAGHRPAGDIGAEGIGALAAVDMARTKGLARCPSVYCP